MKTISNIFILLVMLSLFSGCGNKKSPTGGPEDTEKPVIVNVFPIEFSDITGQDLEITFSKQMNTSSFFTGLYIYPQILAKRYKWEANTLIIKIEEELQDSTNYHFSFTEKIVGIHKNPLDKQYDFTWSVGKFTDNRISGNFTYEKPEDRKEDVRLTLFSADTTLIKTNIFKENYHFEALNNEAHTIRAYIDKNKNKKLDTGKDPFAEILVNAQPVSTVDIHLAYQDSTAPAMKRITTKFTDEIDITFDEEITSLRTVHIFTADSLKKAVRVKRWRIKEKEVKLFIAATDTLDYKLYAIGATDLKNNVAELDSLEFKGITRVDSIAPRVASIYPRNGSSVKVLKPEIKVTFSEVIFKEHLNAWLTESETGAQSPLKIIEGDSEIFILRPYTNLNNYNTYNINLEAHDPRDNVLKDFEGSIFLPIVRISE